MTATPRSGRRRPLYFVSRLAVTAILLAVVLRNVEVAPLLAGLKGDLGPALAGSFVLLLLALVLSTWRWLIVSAIAGIELTVSNATALVFIGHFFNQLLPTSFGGDAVRAVSLWRQGNELSKCLVIVFLDRLTGFFALILLIGIGLPVLAWRLNTAMPLVVAAVILAGGVVGLVLLFNLHRVPVPVRHWRAWAAFESLAVSVLSSLRSPARSAAALGLSLAVHASALYTAAILADSLGAPLSMLDALLIVPTVLMLAALPVSIGGWGVREAGLAGGFALIGLPPDIAITTSVLIGIVNIAGGVAGGLVFLATGSPQPVKAESVS